MVRLAVALTALVLALPAAAAPGLRARGMVDALETTAALRARLEPRRIALVVGIDGYDDARIPELGFAASDARGLAELLRGVGGFDRVELLADGRLGREALLAATRRVAADLRTDDTFVLYFSGHGLALEGDGGLRLFLLASDTDRSALATTAVELDALRGWFGGLEAERKALVIDACFNGEGRSAALDRPQATRDALASLAPVSPTTLSSGEAHLYATSPGRPAFEDDALGGGVYSHFLAAALSWGFDDADGDGDGVVTAWEAHDFARGRVLEHTDRAQVPEATLRTVGLNDLVLAGDPSARRSRDRGLIFDYGVAGGRFAGATLWVDGRARGVFPGTVPVEPGARRVEVRDPDGAVLFAGDVDVAADAAWSLPDLRIASQAHRLHLGTRLVGALGPADRWGSQWGPGYLAIEAAALLRLPGGPAEGLFVGPVLGVGLPPTLVATARHGRFVLIGGADAGFGRDVRRLRLRGAWALRATGIPRIEGSLGGPDAGAGWLLLSMGPRLDVGVVLGPGVALVAGVGAQVTWLDDAEGVATPAPLLRLSVGLELGL